jgi:hypothetical protein
MSYTKGSLARCWLTIERNSTRLFVSDSNSCKVEIWHMASERAVQAERTDFWNEDSQSIPRFVATVAEMDNALKVLGLSHSHQSTSLPTVKVSG